MEIQKSMKQKIITAIILAGFILIGLIACGIVGYLNDSTGRIEPNFGFPEEPSSTNTPIAVELVYCYNPVDLCVVSFGQDNTGNLLIVIRNNIPRLKEFYVKLHPAKSFLPNPTEASSVTPTETLASNLTATPSLSPAETLEITPTETETPTPEPTKASNLYTCQKVQFASDVYYCMGSLIADGSMVTMDVYSKSDDQLIANGEILISVNGTPPPVNTEETTSTVTAEPTNTEMFTVTPGLIKTATPTPTTLPSPTKTISAYPYSYP